MFDTTPILWLLQSWSSPALTKAMNVVSLLGYFPSCVAMVVAERLPDGDCGQASDRF